MVQSIWAPTTHSNNFFDVNLSVCSFPDGNGPKETPWEFNKENTLTKAAVVPSGKTSPSKSLEVTRIDHLSAPNGTQHRFHQRWGFGKGFHLASNEVTWCYAATQYMVFNMFVWVNHRQSTKAKWAWSFNKFWGLSSVFGLCWLVWWRTPPFSSWQNDVGLATLQTTSDHQLTNPLTARKKNIQSYN